MGKQAVKAADEISALATELLPYLSVKGEKIMKARLIAIFLTVFLGTSDIRAGTVIGSGTMSCGEWIAEKNEIMRNTHISWVVGYLSGANAIHGGDFLNGYEYLGIAGAIDKYCRENPLKRVYSAANDVIAQMTGMKK